MKENISLNLKNAAVLYRMKRVIALAQQSVRHLDSLNNGTGAGSDFLGWLSLPDDILPSLTGLKKCKTSQISFRYHSSNRYRRIISWSKSSN